jgi:hypothetical protein
MYVEVAISQLLNGSGHATSLILSNPKHTCFLYAVCSCMLQDHAKYKYLLSADGSTASSRLAKLLLTNSVTFKEESGNIEYYYR